MGFTFAPGLLPLETIERRKTVLYCCHPRPSFGSWHHLLVPLAPVRDLFALGHPRWSALRTELFGIIHELHPRSSVLVNAGPRQDVAQVHFHVTDELPIDAGGAAVATWTSWESAVLELTAVPEIATVFQRGFSLIQLSSGREVHLVTS